MEPVEVIACSVKVKEEKPQMLDTLPEYQSTSEEELDVASSSKKRRKKTDKRWQKEQVFQNKESAEQAVNSEGVWSFYHKNVDKFGNVSNIYRCNKVRYRGEQCQAGVYLNYLSHNTEIILYRSQLAHNCDKLTTKSKTKISEATKNEIKGLFEFDTKIKPKRIIEILAEKKLKPPNMVDLKNYLASLRKKTFGPHSISVGELERYFIDNSDVPEDEKTGFVVSYETEYDEPSYFRFFASSKTLLKLAVNAKHIHADANYKIIWQGFPIFAVGTTDKTGQFHPFGFGVCSNEQTEDFIFLFEALKLGIEKVFGQQLCPTTIVCDASSAIRDAFTQVFGEETRIVMCSTHVKKNVQIRAQQLVRSKSEVTKIISDLDFLQLSKTDAVFQQAADLFIQKWQEQAEFVAYFKQEWLEINRNWFEGISDDVPSTNNALEAFNRVIKNENTLRQRLSVDQFSATLMQYIETWSNNYITNIQTVNVQPKVDIELWTKAYHWAKQDKTIIIENTPDFCMYFSPSQDKRAFSEDDMQRNKTLDFDSFDEYKLVMFNIWTTTLPRDQEKWMDGKCDCPTYFKKGICKHIVGVAIRMRIVIPPPEAKAHFGTKRRRGRPSKS